MQKRTSFGRKELDNFQERCRTNPLAPKSHFPISSTYPPTVIPYTPRSHPSTRERLQECTRDRRAVCVGGGGGFVYPSSVFPPPHDWALHISTPRPIPRITTDQKYPCPLCDCDERLYYICWRCGAPNYLRRPNNAAAGGGLPRSGNNFPHISKPSLIQIQPTKIFALVDSINTHIKEDFWG